MLPVLWPALVRLLDSLLDGLSAAAAGAVMELPTAEWFDAIRLKVVSGGDESDDAAAVGSVVGFSGSKSGKLSSSVCAWNGAEWRE